MNNNRAIKHARRLFLTAKYMLHTTGDFAKCKLALKIEAIVKNISTLGSIYL